MRVAMVVDSESWGGAEVYVAHLLRRAAACGVEAHVLSAAEVCGRYAGLGAARSVTAVPLSRHAPGAPEVLAALRSCGPDVVLVNLVDPASNAGVLEAALAVAPTVATLHLCGDTAEGPGTLALTGLYGRLAHVLTPAAEVRAQVVAELGVPAGRVTVVPNGVDVPPVASGPAGRRPPVVGAVGRLTKQKGFDVLLAAVRSLRESGVELEAAVAGTGRDAAALHAAATGLPVRFEGFVADVPGWLGGLDVFCLPSRREAMPLALLEAMAAGLPCVATDVGAVREAVQDAAVVVPPEDPAALAAALRSLLADPDRRLRLGRRARSRAEASFDGDLMARRTFAVLRAAVRPPGLGSATADGWVSGPRPAPSGPVPAPARR